MTARFICKLHGKRVFRVPVVIRCNDSHLCRTIAEAKIEVIAYSPADAANWVVDHYNRPETEVFAYGPKGGKTHRYIGWESSIWRAMCNQNHHQLAFTWS